MDANPIYALRKGDNQTRESLVFVPKDGVMNLVQEKNERTPVFGGLTGWMRTNSSHDSSSNGHMGWQEKAQNMLREVIDYYAPEYDSD